MFTPLLDRWAVLPDIDSSAGFFLGEINFCLTLFVVFLVLETRKPMLKVLGVLFGDVTHLDQGGLKSDVEDTHHAGKDRIGQRDSEDIEEVQLIKVRPKTDENVEVRTGKVEGNIGRTSD
ncbi:hypothetical protein BKA64DRAFT_647444 [Cadophora sp. MPI-SDFR-AT-0126]|nr:hypothetical protein BKA64DRAFT_647444 [Leotiomycetes sp. MPI-SDFR-AT-0126]